MIDRANLTDTDRDELVRRMKQALRPSARDVTDKEGNLRDWFMVQKANGLAAYSFAEMEGRYLVTMLYVDGYPQEVIAEYLGVHRTTIWRKVRRVFESAINNMPDELMEELLN